MYKCLSSFMSCAQDMTATALDHDIGKLVSFLAPAPFNCGPALSVSPSPTRCTSTRYRPPQRFRSRAHGPLLRPRRSLSLSLSLDHSSYSRALPLRALSLSLSPTRALPLRSLSLSLSHSYSRALFLNPSLQVRAFRARVLAADIASQRWPFLAALRGSHRRTNASLTPTGALRRRTPGRSW